MLLAPSIPPVSNTKQTSQNDTAPSDFEILRRVMKIRSSWSVEERIERRQEADRRFEALVDAMIEADTAA